jgi:hypothetical protein
MRKSESGYVLVTVASLLVVLVGFTALAIDMGSILSSRAQIQRAADAAALAGAFSFTANTSAVQPDTAISHATTVATANTVMGIAIPSGEVSVSVSLPNLATNTPAYVTVTITHTQSTFFATVLNVTGIANTVTATAESGVTATSAYCVRPFFIPNTVVSGSDPCTAAANGQILVSGGLATSYATSNFGTELTLKPSDPAQALTSGNFYEIDINGGGGSAYSTNISSCNTTQFVCQNSYDVLTGNKMGPTIQGVKALIGNPPDDTYVSVGQYQTANGIQNNSKALILAPITDLSTIPGFCPAPVGTCTSNCEQFPSGTNVSVKVVGFALIFLDGAGGGNITGRLINVFPCGAAPPSSNDNGAIAVPLRLVHN